MSSGRDMVANLFLDPELYDLIRLVRGSLAQTFRWCCLRAWSNGCERQDFDS